MFLGKSDGVFSHHRFAGRRVCGHKHRVVLLQPEDGLLLENIQLKWPLRKKKQRQTGLYKGEVKKQTGEGKDAPCLESWVGDAFVEIIAG